MWYKIITLSCHFYKTCKNHATTLRITIVKLGLDQIKLVLIALARLVTDKIAKLWEDIRANLDHSLVNTRCLHHIKHFECSILLQSFIWLVLTKASDDLSYSKPKIFVDIITCIFNQLNNHIDVPTQVFRKLLSKNCHFENNFFLQINSSRYGFSFLQII